MCLQQKTIETGHERDRHRQNGIYPARRSYHSPVRSPESSISCDTAHTCCRFGSVLSQKSGPQNQRRHDQQRQNAGQHQGNHPPRQRLILLGRRRNAEGVHKHVNQKPKGIHINFDGLQSSKDAEFVPPCIRANTITIQ